MAGFFTSLGTTFRQTADFADEQPIREEMFSVERLEQYAQTLAAEHKVVRKKGRALLLPRLEDNGRKLIASYRTLVEAIRSDRAISPAAEWLVDNFHIVEEQLREIREDLPKSYYYELPKLAEGPLKDAPRIYAIALALIAHTDSRLDTNTMRRFISAYQTVAQLTIGELWALAISLRLALVENLRRLAVRIVVAREERDEADKIADKLLEVAAFQPAGLVPLISDKLIRQEKVPTTFVVQLTQRLRDQDPAVMQVTEWLERQLAAEGMTTEQVIHLEHQRQAEAQVTVGNIITSMRLLSTLEWRDFFESVSLVDPKLGQDPAAAYSRMEFATRDRYRHVVERISKRTSASEAEVAMAAVELAKKAASPGDLSNPRAHVGYYLVDQGRTQLEAAFQYQPGLWETWRHRCLSRPTLTYLGFLVLLTFLFSVTILVMMHSYGARPILMTLAGLLVLVPASNLAVSILNWDITQFLKPRLLPRMDTAEGLPPEAQTMVVVPTILSSVDFVRELLGKLEVHFLANQDEQIYFAILGDFPDANTEDTLADSALLEETLKGIDELNKRYPNQKAPRFSLFHRKRQWNPREGKWMGWERKRGKLHEFNRLTRGANDTSFTVQTADHAFLSKVRYVITLDADTQLPRDVARKLVGTAIHPLMRAKVDPYLKRVTYGYGILQPRVSIALESASRSRFARIFSGNTGIDPYTTAVSDVYQDLFGEGNYTGKGLYDVNAFEAALADRIPENSLLSHDLFESLFARAGLVTDVELLDDYPARYDTYSKRQHRWTRGDWQIVRWLFPNVPAANGRKLTNNLPLISRWKILDNLRRSLVAPSLLLWLVAAWSVFPGSSLLWTLFAVLTIAFPVYLHVTTSLLIHPRGVPWTSQFWNVWGDIRTNTAQVALSLIVLPHQAFLMMDAIIRTLYRKFISHRKLLDWVTAAQAESENAGTLAAFIRFMVPAEVLAIAAGIIPVLAKSASVKVAAALVATWLLAPFVTYWVSRRLPPPRREMIGDDLQLARIVARKTWRFFETFVCAEDNWLPPDNFQQDPPALAHRTSPTNIGLLMLSTVSAHDFGYLGTLEFVERQELTFDTLRKLHKFNGHLLNWYDTRTLEPLNPQYISTVDSGNFSGHLIALKQACVEMADVKLFDERLILGLTDTLALIGAETARLAMIRQRTEVVTVKQLHDEVQACQKLIAAGINDSISSWVHFFAAFDGHASIIEDIVGALSHEHGQENFKELLWWLGALRHQIASHQREAKILTPWHLISTSDLEALIGNIGTEPVSQWRAIVEVLTSVPRVSDIAELSRQVLVQLAALQPELAPILSETGEQARLAARALTNLTSACESAAGAAEDLQIRLARMAQTCAEAVEDMDFHFLLEKDRKVFTIGYNVSDLRHDNSYYDLLASEARLASFIAIAKGDVPQEHWFRMGRQLTSVDGGRALISWAGTMFEYLMPLLVMRNYNDTLLDQTYRAVVRRQIEYGQERGVPWGISESAYNVRDLNLNYQYGPFGVPGLGLKRGLIEDVVIAPYATLLAAAINPRAAILNLRSLEKEGALGDYGYYESIDYTPERLPQNQKRVMIYAFMAHHQGMSLVALNNTLHNGRMENRFHADPVVQATELLLQERIPVGAPAAHPRAEEVLTGRVARLQTGLVTRVYDTAQGETPHVQLLSNGTYSLMITTAGAGYSGCGANAVTRWREDVTQDNWGTFIYLRDVRSGLVWSAGYQPLRRRPQSYQVAFSEDKADFWRSDSGIITHMEIVVSGEDNAEVRHLSITNNSLRTREIELTSYAEIVLAPPQADLAHPAFSNLFIETEFFGAENALLAHRRQRSSEEDSVWGVHVIVAEGDAVGAVQYETDRGRFLGRGHTPADPMAVMEDRPLSNTVGAVLDPVFSLRRRVRIKPNQTARVTFSTAVANSREQAMMLADKYHDPSIFEREARLAWTKAQVEMSHLSIDAEDAHLFQRLAERVIYSEPTLRPRPHVLALNTKAQSSLWAYGISGDLPIVVVRINRAEDLPIVRKLIRGHEYLHYKGLDFDLVILNDHPPTYLQSLQDELQAMIRTSALQWLQEKPGGAFLRRVDLMPEPDRILIHSVARAVIVTERGSLEEQLERKFVEEPLPKPFLQRLASQTYPEQSTGLPELQFFNGLGGFNQTGQEYVIVLADTQWTPAPWSNVIANGKGFGFLVTETGGGYTWSVNSRENKLTPWSNDAVSDPPAEAVYLRDEETGTLWSVTPLPVREAEPYTIRHGQGYTVFEHTSHGISQELLLFVPLDASVKISLLRLRNRTNRRRRLSVTMYNELVLGVFRNNSAPHLITEIAAENSSIFARNPFNNEFAGRVAFVATSEPLAGATCDRKEFLGRNGSTSRPAALRRAKLSGRDGAGLDPCAALQVTIELAPGEAREVSFLLGEAESREEAEASVENFRRLATVNEAFERVLSYWDRTLSTISVQTPDAAMDTLLNRWLLYQTLSCRVWARSAFYQAGGAYGFRDQLQDIMALAYSAPTIAREQILLAAGRQFKEGDVQHWWHPPSGRGVRTRFSDDLLWLPYVAAFYVGVTGDTSVLDEMVPFLEGPPLAPGEPESYMQPLVSTETASLFEHCLRTLDRSLAVGRHGLPLMGAGDWNDGMNRVGQKGEGESVWVGWFLYTTLKAFVSLCEDRKDQEHADRYRNHLENLREALEEHGWDGDWYRRAYFDDGTPLGSAQNEECRIDSIAQSWAVISGAADQHRAGRAMAAVEEYLIRRGDGLIILFTPPFDRGHLDPGYIKGYVPGVRENGGQYTHAALWALIAFAMLGDGDRAGELFSLLNPINHGSTRAGLHKYKVEPYVAAADVYAVPPHTGRGGWTWYTGSAGWMYRAGLESILGFRLLGNKLQLNPCIPKWWREFEIVYRHGRNTYYRIKVENPSGFNRGVASVELDGKQQTTDEIFLVDDGQTHNVRMVMGERLEKSISETPETELHEEGVRSNR